MKQNPDNFVKNENMLIKVWWRASELWRFPFRVSKPSHCDAKQRSPLCAVVATTIWQARFPSSQVTQSKHFSASTQWLGGAKGKPGFPYDISWLNVYEFIEFPSKDLVSSNSSLTMLWTEKETQASYFLFVDSIWMSIRWRPSGNGFTSTVKWEC